MANSKPRSTNPAGLAKSKSRPVVKQEDSDIVILPTPNPGPTTTPELQEHYDSILAGMYAIMYADADPFGNFVREGSLDTTASKTDPRPLLARVRKVVSATIPGYNAKVITNNDPLVSKVRDMSHK